MISIAANDMIELKRSKLKKKIKINGIIIKVILLSVFNQLKCG